MASAFKKTDNTAEIDRLALALAKEPGSKVFIPLAEEYGKAGMWEEAAAVLEDGLKIYPHFITAMVALGRVYEQVNQPAKAKAILEDAIKLSPDNLKAHRTLARLYAAQGAKDATIRSCNVILAVNPHDQEALSLRSAVTSPSSGAAAASSTRPTSVSNRRATAREIVPRRSARASRASRPSRRRFSRNGRASWRSSRTRRCDPRAKRCSRPRAGSTTSSSAR